MNKKTYTQSHTKENTPKEKKKCNKSTQWVHQISQPPNTIQAVSAPKEAPNQSERKG